MVEIRGPLRRGQQRRNKKKTRDEKVFHPDLTQPILTSYPLKAEAPKT